MNSCFLTAQCRNGWVRFENSCYLFSRLTMAFGDAAQFCNQQGAYLTHIETNIENDFIRNYCMNLQVADRWIGIDDLVQEGRWVWHGTDTTITYNDWYPGEPNQRGDANCGHLWSAVDYHWADHSCYNLHGPICELALDVEIVG